MEREAFFFFSTVDEGADDWDQPMWRVARYGRPISTVWQLFVRSSE